MTMSLWLWISLFLSLISKRAMYNATGLSSGLLSHCELKCVLSLNPDCIAGLEGAAGRLLDWELVPFKPEGAS